MIVQVGPVSTQPGYLLRSDTQWPQEMPCVKADSGLLISEDSYNPSCFQGI
jgi:hypothetical protein